MGSIWQGYLIFVLILILIGAVALFCYFIKNAYREHVRHTSKAIKMEKEVNDKYTFSAFHNTKDYYVQCSSKQQFDRFNQNDYMYKAFKKEFIAYAKIKELIVANKVIENDYKNDLLKIPYSYEKNKIYKKMEQELLGEMLLQTYTSCTAIIYVSYTSPAGRNSYSKEYIYHWPDLLLFFDKVKDEYEYTQSKEYQRRAMTNSMRYDIMKRDGFRCVLCGRAADDGVKLHVDHIIPVAKGGKTEENNLRTLCDMCNTGKSAKYDPDGLN